MPVPSLADLNPSRIALIKPSALGDVVHTLPILHALRRRFPASRISWVINRSFEPLLAGHPDLDETLPFDRHGGIRAAFRLARDLLWRRFDLVLDLQGLLRSGLMAASTRASRRVGLSSAREGARWFYTDVVPDDLALHAVDRYWRVATALGVGHEPKRFDLRITDAARDWVNRNAPTAGSFMAVAPGSRWATKRWPVEHFNSLIARVQREFGFSAVLVGSSEDRAIAARITAPCLNLVGMTTLPQLAALLDRADIVLANDSGPLHLAAALGRPVVAPYTCTTLARHGPYASSGGVETTVTCRGSYLQKCSRLDCHVELSPERLWPALHEVLARWASRCRSA